MKIDHQLSAKLKIAGFYSHGNTTSHNLVGYGSADGMPKPIAQGTNYISATNTIRLSLDDSITPTMLLHVGVGMVYYKFADDSPITNFDTLKELGLKGTHGEGRFPHFAGLTSGSYARLWDRHCGPTLSSARSLSAGRRWAKPGTIHCR